MYPFGMEANTPKPESKHFGKVGVRGRWIAVYDRSRSFDGTDFVTGKPTTRWMHKFSVGDNVAIWWTGAPVSIEHGEQVVLVATVKLHDTYTPQTPYGKGKPVRQTSLSRVNIHPVVLCEACGGPLIEKDKKCPACAVRVGKTELFF